jgi:hypothetical protein
MNFKKAVRFLLALAVLSMATPGNTLLAEDNAAIPGTKCPQKVAVLIETVKPTIFLEYQYF